MEAILSAAQIVVSIFLVVVVLLQERSSGIGGAFGGSSEVYHTRRGLEKLLLWATIVLAILFTLLAIANLLV
jgi:preprotein translocase subunit SecG